MYCKILEGSFYNDFIVREAFDPFGKKKKKNLMFIFFNNLMLFENSIFTFDYLYY